MIFQSALLILFAAIISAMAATANLEAALEAKRPDSSPRILIAYFSMPETTTPGRMTRDEANSVVVIDGKVLGNTQYVAQVIQENTGADIFRIEPKTPYPVDHKRLVDLAKRERDNNARPELAAKVAKPEQYDVVFVGYPIWYADLPMVLYTFLESHNLSGKTVVPFSTHGGSGLAGTIAAIASSQPNARVVAEGFTVSRNSTADAGQDIVNWLRRLGY